jgi:ACT domain-containing protein|tara:strand:- start:7643 stop:7981 length:339 start_codon:yes stop_codon:yes gene_type:complete
MSLKGKKKIFIDAFHNKAGNITEACKAANINRSSYYDWLEMDDKFKNAVDEVKETLLDFTESKLMENIQNNDTKAIIFKLKCHGKKRDYVERVEQKQEITGSSDIVISFKDL